MDEANAVRTVCYTVLAVTWWRQLFASRVSSRCKQDMGTLSWLHVETLNRAPTPLYGRLVRLHVETLNRAPIPLYGRLVRLHAETLNRVPTPLYGRLVRLHAKHSIERPPPSIADL